MRAIDRLMHDGDMTPNQSGTDHLIGSLPGCRSSSTRADRRRDGRVDGERPVGPGGARWASSVPVGGGDVRAGGRHVADERVDRRGGRRSRHHGQQRAVGHRPRGAGVGGVHPDRQQGRRPHRAQEGLRAGAARLRRRRPVDGLRPERHGDRHLLGHRGRARGVAAAAGHAVADPRQLRRRRATQGLRPRRCGRRRSPPPSGRCSAASSPPTCRGASGSCSRSSSSPSCCRASVSSATSPTPARDSVDVVGSVLSVLGMGGLVLGILAWQEGGESVGALLAVGAIAMAALIWWLRAPQASRPSRR